MTQWNVSLTALYRMLEINIWYSNCRISESLKSGSRNSLNYSFISFCCTSLFEEHVHIELVTFSPFCIHSCPQNFTIHMGFSRNPLFHFSYLWEFLLRGLILSPQHQNRRFKHEKESSSTGCYVCIAPSSQFFIHETSWEIFIQVTN